LTDLLGLALRDDAPRRHEIDVIHHAQRLLHIVRDDDGGRAERIVEVPDEAHDDAERDRVKAGEGLVVEDELRIESDRARERYAPRHAAGKLSRHELRRTAQPHRLELQHDQVMDQGLRKLGVLAQRERHVLVHRHVGKQRPELEQHAHAAAHAVQALAPLIGGQLAHHPCAALRG
jgi:hypothetical protein